VDASPKTTFKQYILFFDTYNIFETIRTKFWPSTHLISSKNIINSDTLHINNIYEKTFKQYILYFDTYNIVGTIRTKFWPSTHLISSKNIPNSDTLHINNIYETTF